MRHHRAHLHVPEPHVGQSPDDGRAGHDLDAAPAAEQHEEHAVVDALAPDAPQVEEPAREVAVRGGLGEAVEPRDVLEQHDRELDARRRVQRLKVAIDRRGRFGAQDLGRVRHPVPLVGFLRPGRSRVLDVAGFEAPRTKRSSSTTAGSVGRECASGAGKRGRRSERQGRAMSRESRDVRAQHDAARADAAEELRSHVQDPPTP